MDGAHDLGGRLGFGPVRVEKDEPLFHAPWETRVRGIKFAIGKAAGADPHQQRHAIERMDPGHYLTASYYERWLTGAATIAVEQGLVSLSDLEARAGGHFPLSRPARFSAALIDPESSEPIESKFAPGTVVQVRDVRPLGHSRCPWYVRGRTGVIIRDDGKIPIPDLAAHRLPDRLDHSNCVRFKGADLFEEVDPKVAVFIDLLGIYLEEAP